MIVDVHTHTPTHRGTVPEDERVTYGFLDRDPPIRLTNSWDDHDRAQADADVSIVFNIAVPDPFRMTGLPADPARVNESTAEFVAAAPDRRVGFMSVDPGNADALEELDRACDLGLVGIKLAPNYQRFDPLSAAAHAVYGAAAARGLPILFHQGTSPLRDAPLRWAHPLAMDEIAMAHPELRVVMAHMGHPWTRDTVMVLRKHPHVYADVSVVTLRPWHAWQALIAAVEWDATHKLLLGSDFPISDAGRTIAGLRDVNRVVEGTGLPRIPDAAIEAIVNADALGALGLELSRGSDT